MWMIKACVDKYFKAQAPVGEINSAQNNSCRRSVRRNDAQ